jgi:hypothetical protein
MTNNKIDDAAQTILAGLAWTGGVLSIFCGLIYRCFIWLRDGYWTELPFSLIGLPKPQIGWVGIQKMIDFYYSSPIDIVLSASSVAVFMFLYFAIESQ